MRGNGTTLDAEQALSEAFGARVRLGHAEPLGSASGGARSTVFRQSVVDGPSGVPASVIVKRANSGGGEAYDPDSPHSGPARRLLNEWAGLAFLREVADGGLPVPRVLAGDRAAGLIVLEDLESGVGLHDLLLGPDPAAARGALVGYAATLGRMHARTSALRPEYDRIRAGLGPMLPPSLIESTAAEAVIAPEQQAGAFSAACAASGVTPAPGLDADLAEALSCWAAPGPFLAYAHGDPCPDNCLWRASRVWLVDHEFGGFGHALTDAVYGHLLFPTCWCVGRLPAGAVRDMEAAYRAELRRGSPAAADDRTFARGLVAAGAYWVTGMCHWAFPAVLARDEAWGTATWRQRVLVRLEVLAGAAARAGYLEALGATAGALAAVLRCRWAGAVGELAPYPAFER